MEKKFKEQYLEGNIEFEAIDAYIEEWNQSQILCTLREYLGFDSEEEDIWIEEGDESLKEMLDRQRNQDIY